MDLVQTRGREGARNRDIEADVMCKRLPGLCLAPGALRPPRAARRAGQLDRAQVHPQDRLQRDGRGQGQLRRAALRQAEISGRESALSSRFGGYPKIM